jgi:hypothetical protein
MWEHQATLQKYTQKTYKMPDDIVKTSQQMQRPTLAFPPRLLKLACTNSSRNFDKDKCDMPESTWKEDYKAVMTRMEKYEENELNALALIYDQCFPELKNKLEGAYGYKNCNKNNNVVLLLRMIKGYCYQYNILNEYLLLEQLRIYYICFRLQHSQTPPIMKTLW